MQASDNFLVFARRAVTEHALIVRVHEFNERTDHRAPWAQIENFRLPLESLDGDRISCVESGNVTISMRKDVAQAVVQSSRDP